MIDDYKINKDVIWSFHQELQNLENLLEGKKMILPQSEGLLSLCYRILNILDIKEIKKLIGMNSGQHYLKGIIKMLKEKK